MTSVCIQHHYRALLFALACTACGNDRSVSPDQQPTPDAAPKGDLPREVGWHARADLPAPSQETAVVAVGGRVFVLGGFKGGAVVADVDVYDSETNTWSKGPALPTPLHHVNAAAVGSTIYVLGALVGSSFEAIGSAWALDTTSAAPAWIAKASLAAGQERGASAVGVLNTRVIVAGGFRGGAVAEVSIYETDADRWTAALPLPEARDHLMGAAVGGRFFAIGGRDGAIAAIRSRVDVYDPDSDAWTAGKPMPTARGGGAAGVVGGRIVVVGGEGNPAAPRGVFAATEIYDPATDSWQVAAPMPRPRHGMGAAAVRNGLFVPGGANTAGFGATAEHDVFIP